MKQINIDELCEPIEVTVGGKTYQVADIPQDTAKRMQEAGDDENIDILVATMTEILGAEKADIQKLGMRKLLALVSVVMGTITEEITGKNAPGAVATP